MTDFTGGIGNDTFNGGAGDDTAHGGGGNDTLSGLGGTDLLLGEAGDDTLHGGDEMDHINGGAGRDNLFGGAGDDFFVVLGPSELVAGEQIDGGTGLDQLSLQIPFDPFNPFVAVDLSSLVITSVEQLMALGAGFLGDVRMTAAQLAGFHAYLDASSITLTTGGSVTLNNVGGRHGTFNLAAAGNTLDMRNDAGYFGVQVNGAAGADTVYGTTAFGNHLFGGGGNDLLYGGTERDHLSGGEGNDQLDGGAAEDWLVGDAGNDTLNGGLWFDHLTGGAGVDILHGGDGDDELILDSSGDLASGEVYDGGAGTDTLRITSTGIYDLSSVTLTSIERIENTYGSVLISVAQIAGFTSLSGTVQLATAGAVTLSGNYGDLHIVLNPAGNSIDAGASTGGIRVTGSDIADTLIGGAGFDQLNGGGGNDVINGGGGNDHLRGGAGADQLQGGAGDDVIFYDAASDFAAGETINGGAGFDIIRGSIFGGSVDLSTATLAGIDGIDGTFSLTAAQLDALTAVHGNLTLTTGGTVTMAGVVTADQFGSQSTLTFTLAAAGNVLSMTGYAAPFTNVFGQGGIDTVIGSASFDNVYGGAGNDTISGNDGNDRIVGGAGADVLNGGNGDDLFVIDAASDLAAGEQYAGGAGFDILQLNASGSVNLTVIDLSGLEGVDARFSTARVTLAQLDAMTAVTGHFVLTTAGTASMNGVVAAANGNAVFTLADGTNVFNLTGYAPGQAQVNGGSGADTITGYFGFDWLIGNGGNDVLNGGTGADRLDGGLGNDFFYVDNNLDEVLEASGQGTDQILSSISFSLGSQEVENLTLIGSALNGTGNALANRLVGTAAANVLDGGAGADTLTGGAGDDTYKVDNAGDVVVEVAGGGTDTVQSSATHALHAEVENLSLTGAAAINGTGNALANLLTGNDAANVLDGGLGADTIVGGAGNDSLLGGGGADRLTGGAGADLLDGGSEADTFVYLATSDSAGAEVDRIRGFQSGVDKIDLLALSTTVSLSQLTDPSDGSLYTLVTAAGGAMSLRVDGTIVLSDFILAPPEPDRQLYGTAGPDFLSGGSGNDIILGYGGNDTLIGGMGVDTMNGGLGSDNFFVDTISDLAIEAAGEGTDTVRTSVTYILREAYEVERLVADPASGTSPINLTGNSLANNIQGNAGANIILGNAGNDLLLGFAGNDNLNGGAGNDTLIGGLGDDTYILDNPNDFVIENAAEGRDTIFTTGTYNLNDIAQVELLSPVDRNGTAIVNFGGNSLANIIYGNAGANVLLGNGGDDVLLGLAGDDILNGGAGADIMTGGTGNDIYYVDSIDDQVVENAGEGTNDRLFTSVTYTLREIGDVEQLVAADRSATTAMNLTGNSRTNTLQGNDGANILDGKDGNDALLGFGGADTFVFSTALDGATNVDTIVGFVAASDKILLDGTAGAPFASLAAGTLVASAFTIGSGATTAAHRIVYDSTSGGLFFDADGSGAGVAVQFAILSPGLALTNADFVIADPLAYAAGQPQGGTASAAEKAPPESADFTGLPAGLFLDDLAAAPALPCQSWTFPADLRGDASIPFA